MVEVASHDELGQVKDAGSQVDGFAEKCLPFLTSDKSRIGRENGGRDVIDAAGSSLEKPRAAHDVDFFPLSHVFG